MKNDDIKNMSENDFLALKKEDVLKDNNYAVMHDFITRADISTDDKKKKTYINAIEEYFNNRDEFLPDLEITNDLPDDIKDEDVKLEVDDSFDEDTLTTPEDIIKFLESTTVNKLDLTDTNPSNIRLIRNKFVYLGYPSVGFDTLEECLIFKKRYLELGE